MSTQNLKVVKMLRKLGERVKKKDFMTYWSGTMGAPCSGIDETKLDAELDKIEGEIKALLARRARSMRKSK